MTGVIQPLSGASPPSAAALSYASALSSMSEGRASPITDEEDQAISNDRSFTDMVVLASMLATAMFGGCVVGCAVRALISWTFVASCCFSLVSLVSAWLFWETYQVYDAVKQVRDRFDFFESAPRHVRQIVDADSNNLTDNTQVVMFIRQAAQRQACALVRNRAADGAIEEALGRGFILPYFVSPENLRRFLGSS